MDPSNKEIKESLTDMKTLYFDIKSNIGSCKKYIDENLTEGILRELEKKFEDFKLKDNIGKITVALFAFEEFYNHGFLVKTALSQMDKIKKLFK